MLKNIFSSFLMLFPNLEQANLPLHGTTIMTSGQNLFIMGFSGFSVIKSGFFTIASVITYMMLLYKYWIIKEEVSREIYYNALQNLAKKPSEFAGPYQEVQNMVHPSLREAKNSEGKTPQDFIHRLACIFSGERRRWMKETLS